MDVAASIVKANLVPGSVSLLLFGAGLGVLLLYVPPLRRAGRIWLTALVATYWVLALPVFSDWMQRRGEREAPRVLRPGDARGATAVVVLGNGAVTWNDGERYVPTLNRRSAYNALEGARLYALLGDPLVVASGGIVNPAAQRASEADLLGRELERLGVPAARIVREDRSTNTFEQAVNVRPLVAGHQAIVLVTTPIHMPRTLDLFEAQGMRAIPSSANITYRDPDAPRWRRLVPSASALRTTELMMYERLARTNAQLRGWLQAADAPQ
jgi:uncharacterized SAM-binding protein YcdF (DUF218 family)